MEFNTLATKGVNKILFYTFIKLTVVSRVLAYFDYYDY